MRRTSSVNTPVAFTTIRAANPEILARLLIARRQTIHIAFVIAQQSGCRTIIHQGRTMIRGRHRQMNQQPGIIKLPVVVNNPAAQFLRLERRQPLQRLLSR